MVNTRKKSTTKGNTPNKAPSPMRDASQSVEPTTSTPATEATHKRFCGVKGRSGAPKNNRNALRHGLKSGSLPKDAKYIELRLNNFRRQLEDVVIAVKGEVSLPDAGTIQSCVRWERHACLAHRWLTKQYNELKAIDRLKFSEAIAKASDSRDKAIRTLQLDRDSNDNIIDALYSKPELIIE